MTIFEMYDDDEVIENVAESLKFQNDEVVYIGYNLRNMQKGIQNIRKFFDSIGRKINISCIEVVKNNLPLMLEAIEKVIKDDSFKQDEAIFDVNGGDDLILVAMGILAERYGINLVSFDVVKSKILWQMDTDKAKYPINEGRNELSVRENIILHGGDVVGPDNVGGQYYPWDFNEEFCQDIEKMWDICRSNCLKWNKEISELQNAVDKDSSLVLCSANSVMTELVDIGVLNKHDNQLRETYSFKNNQIREALMKVGSVLELYTCIIAKGILKEDGSSHFSDVKTGVVLDWNGIIHDIHDTEKDTRNEVDVIMMKGVCPIFVSCKNGDVSIDELYKLHTVAEKFGGKYAKMLLIATYFGKKGQAQEYFIQRAMDMKIQIITDAQKLSKAEFVKRLANL